MISESKQQKSASDLSQGSPLVDDQQACNSTLDARSVPRVASKLDRAALTIIIGGCIVILACIGSLAFLWTANSNNSSWHWIVSHNHLQTLVSGLAEALKQVVTMQVGSVTAMTAAIMLESAQTTFGSVASLSLARSTAGSSEALLLLWDEVRGKLRKLRMSSIAPYAIPLLAIVLAVSQVFTVLLVSDLGLSTVAGNSGVLLAPYSFNYTDWANYTSLNGGTTDGPDVPQILDLGSGWNQQTATFATFAEYAEAPIDDPGVDDTGVTLRAFLPFSSQATRQNLHSYEGYTTTVDTRVTCQAPTLDGAPLTVIPDGSNTIIFNASILARQPTPRLFNHTFQWANAISGEIEFNRSIGVGCFAPVNLGLNTPSWRTSLCQLPENMPYAGGLVSEFQQNPPFDEMKVMENPDNQFWWNSTLWGIGHLVLNVTLGEPEDWQAVLGDHGDQHPPFYQIRENWLDLIYSEGEQVLSLSLCYSSFMTADMPVKIQSPTNRTEPSPVYDLSQSKYTFDSVRQMYGQNRSVSRSERGILDLVKADSWLVNDTALPPMESFVRAYTNMDGPQKNAIDKSGYVGNLTALFGFYQGTDALIDEDVLLPDRFHSWLFQEIVQSGGSIAFAMQSLLMFMASTSYYQQLPQFDLASNVTQTQFIVTNVPKSWTGFTVTLVVTIVHLCVMAIVIVAFTTTTKFTKIGDTWQTVAQLVSPATADVLRGATLRSDNKVKNQIIGKRRKKKRVRVDYIQHLDRVGLVEEPVSGTEEEVDEEGEGGRQGPMFVFRRRWKLSNESDEE